MRRQDIHIAEPCKADWQKMDGDEQRRFCDACSKHVHDLSSMARADAEAFLDTHRSAHVCVQYLVREDDEVIFRDDGSQDWKLYWQRAGLKRLMAAATLALPLGLAAACDSPQAPIEPTVNAPIVIKEGQTPRLNTTSPAQPHTAADPVTQPGAGRAPTFRPAQQEEEVELVKGEEGPAPVEVPAPPKEPEIRELKGDVMEPAPRKTEATQHEEEKPQDKSDCDEASSARLLMGQTPVRLDKKKKPSKTERVADPGPKRAKTTRAKPAPSVKEYMGFEG